MKPRTRPYGHLLAFSALLALLSLNGCVKKNNTERTKAMKPVQDVHSFAHPDEVVVTHLMLDLSVDFKKKQLSGKATLTIKNKTGTRQLHLDTRDLTIHRVTLGQEDVETKFSLGDTVKYLGQALVIDILPETDLVTVYYTTNPKAAALQWLEPSQTAGGKKPFLFTQSQAILARTWVPCQDGPGVRMTYSARIKTRSDLMAVMSARNDTVKHADGVYTFDMPQSVPSYLLALAVGDLEFRPLGKRSGVYAEPSLVDKARWEFLDTEKMIAAAEALYGPYRWERYDIVVLPPSFPFGGMENPRLTFATPTVIAGDRSLVSLVAHELAHSWSGNLVTNATWDDFWLNEGLTTYFEMRVMEVLYGRSYSEMLANLAHGDLTKTINDLGPENPDTDLHLNLTGRDPDAGMTDIAYNKGYFFLRMLEETVGRDRWDAFLRDYFNTFAFQTMTSEKFVTYLRENLVGDNASLESQLKIDAWIYGPGLPENCPIVASEEFATVEARVQSWVNGTPAKELVTKDWSTHHWLHFLRKLPSPLSEERMKELDEAFGFTKSGNAEIVGAWLLHTITNKYKPADSALEKFLMHVGRRKFLKPLYTKLAETPEGLELARTIYARARPTYHSVAYNTIDEILKWKK